MYIASHGMRIVASPTAAVAALRSHRSPPISSKPKAQALTYSCSLCPSLKPFTARPLGRRTLSSASGARSVIMAALTVVVTGAGGQTGGLVVRRLHDKQCSVIAIGRSSQSLEEVAGLATTAIVDVTSPDATEKLKEVLQGSDALVIATSAKPQMKPKTDDAEGPPSFFYPDGQMPEQVDYEGQKLQIDAAKAAGVKHVVLVSSMGGTDESNRLNNLGNGKILVWKRKAEEYLIASGLTYTILHPGGLFNEPGGQREIVLGVDDELLAQAGSKGSSRRIPRDDVAALSVAALFSDAAKNRSVDAIAKEEADGPPTTDFDKLYADLKGDCKY